MAGMKLSVLLLAATVILPATSTPHWSQTLPEGQMLYPCAGQNVTFPWEFISGSGDVVNSVKWRFAGRSLEMIAVFLDGNFLPLPAFANRAHHVGGAGLTLDHVTPGDSGNYSVEVIGQNSSGSSFALHHSVILNVTEDLMTTDHELHVRQEAVAEQSNVTDQWHAVLSCGQITFVGQPAFSVEWKTPTENHTESTYYKDGYFHLLLPNPVTEGTYTCTIPQSSRHDSCVHGDPGKASLVVNAVNARMSVMDARQSESEKQVTALKSDNSLLKNQVKALQSDTCNLFKNQMTPKLQGKSDKNIAFHAANTHRDFFNTQQTLVLFEVQTNVGQAYNSSTGVFTVPYSGTYFFIGDATAYGPDSTGYLALVIDGLVVARSYAYNNDRTDFQTGSCHVMRSLTAGQRVWLRSESANNFYSNNNNSTLFSGFLISPDA